MSPFAPPIKFGDNTLVLTRLSLPCLALTLLAFVCWTGACQVSVDYGETAFSCSDGACPRGYSCQQELCVSDDIVAEPDAAIVVPPDASLPDAQAFAACNDSFSAAPGYELCSEDEQSCSFNVNTAGGNCLQACEMLGSSCLAAFANDVILCEAQPEIGDTCETLRNSEICVCARLPL